MDATRVTAREMVTRQPTLGAVTVGGTHAKPLHRLVDAICDGMDLAGAEGFVAIEFRCDAAVSRENNGSILATATLAGDGETATTLVQRLCRENELMRNSIGLVSVLLGECVGKMEVGRSGTPRFLAQEIRQKQESDQ